MVDSKSNVLLQGANLAAFLATVAVNALSNILPLNGKTTAEISDSYPNLFTPAGYVFSIWSVIYTLLLIFAVYQALPIQREKTFLGKIGYLFVLSGISNVSWLFLWHYEQIVLSLVPMFVLLATLIAVYLRLQIGQSSVSLRERLAVHLPFSVYLGWITVATIANMAAALTAVDWDGWGISEVSWTILVIIVALIITIGVISKRRDLAFSLVIMWALGGIVVKQMENQSIVLTAGFGAIIIVITLVARMILPRSK
jgi:benzodiazapine receptor